jgi:hypothetical protein
MGSAGLPSLCLPLRLEPVSQQASEAGFRRLAAGFRRQVVADVVVNSLQTSVFWQKTSVARKLTLRTPNPDGWVSRLQVGAKESTARRANKGSKAKKPIVGAGKVGPGQRCRRRVE